MVDISLNVHVRSSKLTADLHFKIEATSLKIGEGGKQVGKEFYFIAPSNIHTTGVREPLFFGC